MTNMLLFAEEKKKNPQPLRTMPRAAFPPPFIFNLISYLMSFHKCFPPKGPQWLPLASCFSCSSFSPGVYRRTRVAQSSDPSCEPSQWLLRNKPALWTYRTAQQGRLGNVLGHNGWKTEGAFLFKGPPLPLYISMDAERWSYRLSGWVTESQRNNKLHFGRWATPFMLKTVEKLSHSAADDLLGQVWRRQAAG